MFYDLTYTTHDDAAEQCRRFATIGQMYDWLSDHGHEIASCLANTHGCPGTVESPGEWPAATAVAVGTI